MRYLYDKFGWFINPVDTDKVLPFSSSIAPPEIPESGNLWPNYIGNGWELLSRDGGDSKSVAHEFIQIKPTKPWTKLEYMSKFTDSELESIYAAAKVSVQVEVWLEKFKLAQEVYKDDPRVYSGLLALEAAGILVSGRAAEIINS